MKNKKKILFIVVAFIFVLAACSSMESDKVQEEQENSYEFAPGASEDGKNVDETVSDYKDINSDKLEIENRKLIKSGNFTFEAQDIDKTRNQIGEAVKKNNGYISNEQSYSEYDRVNNVLVIRVPAEYFDKLVDDISVGVEKFDVKNIDVSDVTEEFLDIQARLKTKKELEQRYHDLLKKALRVSEILEIEREIGDLRADIESIEGRLKYLSDRVGYSTLTVSYYKKTQKGINFGQKFINGFSNGFNAFIWFLVGIVNLWPFILLVLIIIFLIRRYLKRRRNKKNKIQ